MRETIKLGAVLLLITAVCAGLLGFVNSITKPIIVQKKEQTTQEALKVLIPEAESFVEVKEIEGDSIKGLYVAKKGTDYLGAVAMVAPDGYGGSIELLVGVDKDQVVTGIQVLTHTETPGLGANLTQESFKNQFVGKTENIEVTKSAPNGNQVEAITGATITSKAVTNGVNSAVTYISTHQEALIGGMQ